jgi:hypothetical protein
VCGEPTIASLEINDKGRGQQHGADDANPYHAIDEVWIDTKKNASDEGHELGLASPIDDISNPERARDDTDDESGHGGNSSRAACPDRCLTKDANPRAGDGAPEARRAG